MFNRRDFLKLIAAAGGNGLLHPIQVLGSRFQTSSEYFGIHQFIDNHPEAVFIMRTNVDAKTDSEAKKQAGLDFGTNVFVPRSDGGYPVTNLIAIKPNLKTASFYRDPIGKMGVDTDAYFVEGVIESMKSLGLSGSQFYLRETHCRDFDEFGISKNWIANGYLDVAERTGADLKDLSAGYYDLPSEDITGGKDDLVDVPGGQWFKKIPYIWPINAENTFLLNIAKFKAHGMGLTLSAKNMQGTIAQPYQALCSNIDSTLGMKSEHKNPSAKTVIMENYNRHLADGIPRWEYGLGQETWATRTMDNISTMNFGLCIIEGIYGRDGDGNSGGPNPSGNEDNKGGEAWDFMTNVIIFGKNPFHVDIIGFWLAGHEPGNFGQFHIARERGLSEYLNPRSIPLYLWENGVPTLAPLDDFQRTPLKTYYLKKDSNESYYHLVDEPFDYGMTAVEESGAPDKPEAFVLHQNRPNPFNPYTSIEYRLLSNNRVRLEIYNSSGQLVDVLVDGYRRAGNHMAVWNTGNHASGAYFYRFRYGGYAETKKMVLLK